MDLCLGLVDEVEEEAERLGLDDDDDGGLGLPELLVLVLLDDEEPFCALRMRAMLGAGERASGREPGAEADGALLLARFGSRLVEPLCVELAVL